MKNLFMAALAVTLTTSLAARAEEAQKASESTTKIDAVTPKDAPVRKEGEQDTDEVITNRKLRAETGAKSKYSFSAALSYSGGTVNNPGSDVRPNIGASAFVPIQPALGGSLGGKYRLSATDSLSADVGITIYKPFHDDKKKSFIKRTTVSDPSLTYQTLYKWAGVQNVSSVSLGVTTNEQYRDIGQVGGISFSQTAIYDFGGSKFSAGLAFEAGYTAFDKDKNDLDKDGELLGLSQSDYSFAFYPFAEVEISEKLNLRTVFRPFIFEHVRAKNFGELQRNVFTQSFGLGISVTRDIFLYPNVQFAPEDMRADRTNVGLSANINI